MPSQGQLKLDFEWDDRVERLAREFTILLAPSVPREKIEDLAAKLSILAGRRLVKFEEPKEGIRCHGCDAVTMHDERVRVVMCVRCAMEGGSPGSDG